MIRHALLILGLCLMQAGMVLAHEVNHSIEKVDALAIRLTYADGKPFVFEAFEAYPEGKDAPSQVGRTDAHGRIVLVAGEIKRWRVKAFSADGHGVDLHFEVPAVTTLTAATNPAGMVAAGTVPADTGPNRASLLLFGFSVLLALFGGYQLWLRKQS